MGGGKNQMADPSPADSGAGGPRDAQVCWVHEASLVHFSLYGGMSHNETLTALKGTVRGCSVHSHCRATNVV